MKHEIIPFKFHESSVRALMINGEPWFFARDAADVLGMRNVREVLRHFPDNEKGVTTNDTNGGRQKMTILSEPGIYRLIFQSRKPEAEGFKTWIFTEVLPQIRKTGEYGKTEGILLAQLNALQKLVKRYETRRTMTPDDKCEIVRMFYCKYPIEKISEITKKSERLISRFLLDYFREKVQDEMNKPSAQRKFMMDAIADLGEDGFFDTFFSKKKGGAV